MNAKADMIGMKFGRATVLHENLQRNGRRHFLCVCDCGTEFSALGENLRGGTTNSCGCYARQRAREAKTTHGDSVGGVKSVEMITWRSMRRRCTNPNDHRFQDYGGRGILVCSRWLGSYENFLQDMGRRPTPNHSIERFDNDGDYTPENCYWGTREDQANNKRSTIFLEYEGKRMTLTQWSLLLGVSRGALAHRYYRGHSVERILGIKK